MGEKNKALCKWSKGRYAKDAALLKTIVQAPRYVCLDCGRAAGEKKWLCKPEKLDKLDG